MRGVTDAPSHTIRVVGGHDMKTVWVWTQDELAPIGSGQRRVKVMDHPRKKRYVKVYPVGDESAHPVVISRAAFDDLTIEAPPG